MIRLVTVLAAVLLSSFLGGCSTVEFDDRASRPLPAKLVADMTAKGMTPSDPIFVRIFKQESELEVWKRDRTGKYALLKTYPICRWSGGLGPKKKEGDRQAPEGIYTVTAPMMNPRSQYHLSFDLGYPNRLERALGYDGSALMVHGACTSAGCFAMTDDGVAEIYALAREAFAAGQAGFQVQAMPFRMIPGNLAAHRSDPMMPFWRNLKEGADYFDVTGSPPDVASCERRYVFSARPLNGPVKFDPLRTCPKYENDSNTASLVAAKQKNDDARIAQISAAAHTSDDYADGGMHPAFRKILRVEGAKRLADMTSSGIDVSRPDDALRDPYAESSVSRIWPAGATSDRGSK